MAVTDEQAAALRTYLTGDTDGYQALVSRLDPAAAAAGYSALLSAAFCTAAAQRFAGNDNAAAVIEFIGSIRGLSDELSQKIDARVAERLILAVYTDEQVGDIPAGTRLRTQFLLLAALIAGQHLDDAGLDAFMAEARKLADQWLR